MSASRRARLADAGTYLAYFVICLFFAGPLLWIFSLSIRTAAEVYVSEHPPLAADADARELQRRRSATRSSSATC